MKSLMDNTKNQEAPIKIVIMGLENAGKTTIVDILTKATGDVPDHPPDMYPTKKVERRTLSKKNAAIWDFGGQELYRNEYLANPEPYFDKISFFYYVIDVQDYYRLFGSYMYFMAVYNLIRKFSPEASIFFLFHKMDPNFDANKKNLKRKFLEHIEPFLKMHNKSFIMYDTTIFNLNSLRTAFSHVL
jgi:GTPase SAR1 family protein